MDVWISRGCPRRKFFINRNILKKHQWCAHGITWNVHAAFETLTIYFNFFHLFLFSFFPTSSEPPLLPNLVGSFSRHEWWSEVACMWLIHIEWENIMIWPRAASNARHLQITMIKHSNGMDSYLQTSHSLRRLPPSNKYPVGYLYFWPNARVRVDRLKATF